MCEYCGRQSIAVIAALIDEHDQLRGLGRDLTTAGDVDDQEQAAAVAARMLEARKPRTAVEERGLFPALATEFPEQFSRLNSDHDHIEAALGAITAGVTEDWAVSATSAATELFEHILKDQGRCVSGIVVDALRGAVGYRTSTPIALCVIFRVAVISMSTVYRPCHSSIVLA